MRGSRNKIDVTTDKNVAFIFFKVVVVNISPASFYWIGNIL